MRIIKLENIINELELISDEGKSFLNKKTGLLFHVSNRELEYAEKGFEAYDSKPDWQIENIKIAREILETDNYIQLPEKDEINEHNIMMKFCLSFSDERVFNAAYSLIKYDNDAFYRLNDLISKYNIGVDWYNLKREVFREIAIIWCKNNKIEYH